MANIPPDEAEMEHLLTRLLRMLSPVSGSANKVLVSHAVEHPRDGDGDGDGGAGGSGRPADTGGADGSGRPAVTGGASGSGRPADTDGAGESDGATATGGPGGPVSASEARALIELVSAHGIAQGELAGLLGLDKSTVSRLAAGLERKGWVRRGRDEANQRYVRLYLTPAGGEAADRVWRAWQAREARILASLSDDERAGLAAGLRGLIRGLSADSGNDDPLAGPARQAAGFR